MTVINIFITKTNVILFFEKNIQVQTKLHIVYMSVLQVTRSNTVFYLYILIHIYLSIKTNQTPSRLILSLFWDLIIYFIFFICNYYY